MVGVPSGVRFTQNTQLQGKTVLGTVMSLRLQAFCSNILDFQFCNFFCYSFPLINHPILISIIQYLIKWKEIWIILFLRQKAVRINMEFKVIKRTNAGHVGGSISRKKWVNSSKGGSLRRQYYCKMCFYIQRTS